MASKLKNRQKVEVARALASESQKSSTPDRVAEEAGDEFPAASNIASKIAQRRLPRRTPTSHVKGVGGDLIRRRLSKGDSQGAGPGGGQTASAAVGNVASKRLTFEASIDKSLDEPGARPPPPSRQQTSDRDDKAPK